MGNFEGREGSNGGRIKGRNINPGAILPNMSELAGGPSGDAASTKKKK